MAFRNIYEMREALAGLALNNPKMRLADGSVVDLTMKELKELMDAESAGDTGGLSLGRPARKKRRRSTGRKVKLPSTATLEKYGQQKPEDLGVTYAQVGLLMAATGQPESRKKKEFREILKKKGLLNWNHASEILSALGAAGLLKDNRSNKKDAIAARKIVQFYLSAEAAANPSYAIPLSFPVENYQYAEAPRVAHWSSYPQYSYDQFYRPNTPRTPYTGGSRGATAEAGTGTSVAICNGAGCPSCGASLGEPCHTAHGNPTRPHAARRRRARHNPSPVPIPPSAATAEPKDWPMAQNAGPFLPEMYPYGTGGKPETYSGLALDNPISEFDRHAAHRAGGTLTGGMGWPVKVPHWSAAKNRKQAMIALQYMARGFGNRAEYPKYIRKLAALYSPESSSNRELWTFYSKHRARMGNRMPTMASLRRVKPQQMRRTRRAAANPFG